MDKNLNMNLAMWQQSAKEVTKRVVKMGYDVATSPAVLFGAGMVFWSLQTSGKAGVAANITITTASALSRAYESWTNKERGVPYFVRTVANAITVASVLEHGFHTGSFHVSSIGELWNPIKSVIFPAASSLLAGVANSMQGVHEARHTKPKGAIDDPMLYVGLCDVPAVVSIQGLSPIIAPVVVGLGKSLAKKSEKPIDVETWKDLAAKHLTPAKLYGIGWLAGVISTNLSNLDISAAQALWSAAYVSWDKRENHDLVPDIKRLMRKTSVQHSL